MEEWINKPVMQVGKPPKCPGLCASFCSIDCDLCFIHIFSIPEDTTDI